MRTARVTNPETRSPLGGKRVLDGLESALYGLFIIALAWVPFWYGSNVLLAWGVNAILFPGLAILYEISLFLRGRPHPVAIRTIAWPAVLFLAVVAWIGFQTVTGTPLSWANPVWTMASRALARPSAPRISVNPDLSVLALLRLLTAASAFWVALQWSRDRARAHGLIKAVAIIGAGYAAYGLIATRTGPLPWLDIPAARNVSASFVNRDSYATYAGLGLIATIGLLAQLYDRTPLRGVGNWRLWVASLIEATGRGGGAALAAAFAILAALLLTDSRGGIFATGIALLAFLLLGWRAASDRRANAWVVPGLGLGLVLATVLLFGGAFADKLGERGLSDPSRLAVYRLTLQSIHDRPWLGWGDGTFIDVFAMYRDRSIGLFGTWGQAHDTYLELLQGLGLVFGTLLIAAVGMLVLRCVGGARRRHIGAMVPCVAASAAILVGLHALVDFSLQIQAVALTFAVLLGAGVAQAQNRPLVLEDESRLGQGREREG